MGCGGKGPLARLVVTIAGFGDDVVGDIGQQGRVFGQGVLQGHGASQGLVINEHGFTCVFGRLWAAGHHGDDGFSDKAHAISRQNRARGRRDGGAIGPLEVDRFGHGFDAQFVHVLGGVHRQDARHLLSRCGVNARDVGVGMRGAHKGEKGLARVHHVIGVLTQALEQLNIFDARNGLTASVLVSNWIHKNSRPG